MLFFNFVCFSQLEFYTNVNVNNKRIFGLVMNTLIKNHLLANRSLLWMTNIPWSFFIQLASTFSFSALQYGYFYYLTPQCDHVYCHRLYHDQFQDDFYDYFPDQCYDYYYDHCQDHYDQDINHDCCHEYCHDFHYDHVYCHRHYYWGMILNIIIARITVI